MPKVKKIPQRQCVGCREMKDKKALLRVVKARALERAFDTAIPPEVYDAMEAELRGADGPA